MGYEDNFLLIRKSDFLNELSDEDYVSLNLEHNIVVADKGTYVYFDAQALNRLYFVKDGYIKIGCIDDEGNDIVKEILQPGDIFGQFTLERNNMQGEYAQAYKCTTSLCSFTLEDFQRLLMLRPDLSVQYAKKVGQKLRKVENRLMNLLQKDARSRLLYFFWTLLPLDNDVNDTSYSMDNFLTHEDIARLTGTSRQTVTTLINEFANEGLLDVDRRTIVIHNIKSLQKLAKIG
ncbi:hypothetical protein CAP35_08970 [Chitinophagaceae bacterium IBVUCB1]|nr:hypothetical protein CAP35_08970 [Chitinophagaceae bacterium IBVUCB1]